MATTPMDIDSRPAGGTGAVGPGLVKHSVIPATAKISDTIRAYRPTRHWQRDYHNRPVTTLSLDFDDKGELLMSSDSDETIQIYTVVDGKFQKTLASKKYGVKLAKFTHHSTSIVYASTKENDDIRYLSTHDNSFQNYFKGHTASVTSLTMQPSSDNFLSTSLDNTLRLWDINTAGTQGILHLHQPTLSAFDPSGNVMAVASVAAQTVLLYDYRNYTASPFATFDMLDNASEVSKGSVTRNWTKLEFSNDGKSLLVGTSNGHFVLDAFDGSLKQFLKRKTPGPNRLAPGEVLKDDSAQNGSHASKHNKKHETSGDCCFTPDGRFVLSANGHSAKNGGGGVSVYDIYAPVSSEDGSKVITPICELESTGKEGCDIVEFNPRWQMFATAGKGVEFWVPDRDAL